MFTIRKTTQADFLPAALILEGAKVKMFTEGIVQWDSGYTTPAYMQKDLDNGYLYVAEKDGEIAAHITIIETQEPQYLDEKNWKDSEGKPCCIRRMAVKDVLQGQGIGTETVRLACEEIRKMGYTSVRFDAFQKNPSLQKMVDKAGFTRIGVVLFSKGPYDLCELVF